MKQSFLRRLSLMCVCVCVYSKAQFLKAVEPEDILAPVIGPVVILPKATISTSYDDNVFLSGNKIKDVDDVITTFSSGVATPDEKVVITSSTSLILFPERNTLSS